MESPEFEQCIGFPVSVGLALRFWILGLRAKELLHFTHQQFIGCCLHQLLFRRGCWGWVFCLLHQGNRVLLTSDPTGCWLSSLVTISDMFETLQVIHPDMRWFSNYLSMSFPRANLVAWIIHFKPVCLKSVVVP